VEEAKAEHFISWRNSQKSQQRESIKLSLKSGCSKLDFVQKAFQCLKITILLAYYYILLKS